MLTDNVAVHESEAGPSLPHRPPAFVSVIRCLAAALVPWPARQLMTHFGSGVCVAAGETMLFGAGNHRKAE